MAQSSLKLPCMICFDSFCFPLEKRFTIQLWLLLPYLLTGVIFPSLLQLQRGITDVEDRKQKDICATKYRPRDMAGKGKLSEIDIEREEECGICLEMNNKVVLPNCYHSMCMKCYRDWWANCDYALALISLYYSMLSPQTLSKLELVMEKILLMIKW